MRKNSRVLSKKKLQKSDDNHGGPQKNVLSCKHKKWLQSFLFNANLKRFKGFLSIKLAD